MKKIAQEIIEDILNHEDYTNEDIFYNGLCSKVMDEELPFEKVVLLHTEVIESLRSINLERPCNLISCFWWNIVQEEEHSPILSTFNRLTLENQFEKIGWMQKTFHPEYWTGKMISLLPNLRFPNKEDFDILVNPIVLFEVLKTFKENDETMGTEWAAYYMVQLTKTLRLILLNNPS